ncbi:Aspartate aminotransferase, mitochondrial [Galdieria sulphuraria]|nr:Aspartate aminotransferase, mitochondrial [Galdieria sulphuraria]
MIKLLQTCRKICPYSSIRRSFYSSRYNGRPYRDLFSERKEPFGKMPKEGTQDIWKNLSPATLENYLNTSLSYQKSEESNKLDLATDVLLDENGNPFVFESVLKAQERISPQAIFSTESSILGDQEFLDCALELAYGSEIYQREHIAAVETVGGTSALRTAFEFISRCFISLDGQKPRVYVPNMTWPNHKDIIRSAGLKMRDYRSYRKNLQGVDLKSCLSDLFRATKGSVALLQASGQNPTGTDFLPEQWQELSQILKDRKYLCVVDMAHQGLVHGNIDTDALGLRQLIQDGHQVIVCQSLSKSFSLQGNAIGTLSVVTSDQQEKESVWSHLRSLTHSMYCHVPNYGRLIVKTILLNEELRNEWIEESRKLVERIQETRQALHDKLVSLDTPVDWSFLLQQKGMFLFTALEIEQVEQLRKGYGIYLQPDGRLNLGALRMSQVERVATSIQKVIHIKETQVKEKEAEEE